MTESLAAVSIRCHSSQRPSVARGGGEECRLVSDGDGGHFVCAQAPKSSLVWCGKTGFGMPEPEVEVICPGCATRNRVPTDVTGRPACGKCRRVLPMPSLARRPTGSSVSTARSLNRAAKLRWASSFRSDFLPFDAPFDFRSLRDECTMLRRKLSDGPTDSHRARANELLHLVKEVEEYNSLGLRDATSKLISRWATFGQAEEALRAFAGLDSFRPRHVGVAAKIADLRRHHVLSLQDQLRRETRGRAWLPQLEESLERLESGVDDGVDRQSVLAIAELFASEELLRRFEHLLPIQGVPAPALDPNIDVEAAVRLLAEPLGFIRISDAIDRLISAEVSTSLPNLRTLLDAADDATPLADGWWCFTPLAVGPEAPALRTALKIAAVSGRPFHTSDLHRALINVVRDDGARQDGNEVVPSLEALAEWSRLAPELETDQGMISAVSGQADPLSESEWTIVDVIAAQVGGICTSDRLLEQCSDLGLPNDSVWSYLGTGVIVEEVAKGIWGLRGADRDEQAIGRLQANAPS